MLIESIQYIDEIPVRDANFVDDQPIKFLTKEGELRAVIGMQSGPVGKYGVNGLQVDDILEFAVRELRQLNKGLPCRDTSIAITHVEDAILRLKRRRELRQQQGVEGTNQSHHE